MSKKDKAEISICLPGETGWELWQRTAESGGFSLTDQVSLESGGTAASFKAADVYGYPVTAAYAVPIWASTSDQSLLDDIVDMQLEKAGVKPEDFAGRSVDYKVIDHEENSTLMLATVLTDAGMADMPKQNPDKFEVSPALYYLPDNHLVIWKELEKIVFAITRQDRLIYFQALSSPEVDSNAVHEIQCLLMQLSLQDTVTELEGVEIWTDQIAMGAEAELRAALECPVRASERPAPALPLTASELMPEHIAIGRIRAAKRSKWQRIIALATIAYLAIAGTFLGRFFLDHQKVSQLREEATYMKELTQHVPVVERRFDEVTRTLLNEERYALEVFKRCVFHLRDAQGEPQGVRMTVYDFNNGKVQIKGEAEGTPKAQRYQLAVSRDPLLEAFKWNVPNPNPPGGRSKYATFQIDGELKELIEAREAGNEG